MVAHSGQNIWILLYDIRGVFSLQALTIIPRNEIILSRCSYTTSKL